MYICLAECVFNINKFLHKQIKNNVLRSTCVIYTWSIVVHWLHLIEYISAVVLYAGDMLLIAQPVSELHNILECCETEVNWLDISINTTKPCSFRIDKRHYMKRAIIETVSGYELQWVSEVRYLGN